jgi:hypothetical protein
MGVIIMNAQYSWFARGACRGLLPGPVEEVSLSQFAQTPPGLRWIIVAAALAAMTAAGAANPGEAPFLAENRAAMATMMRHMTVKPSGDVDRDFMAMMIPHHQGAIDMARAELRYGHDERLHRIAQEIIVDQQQEIAAMRLALREPLPPSSHAVDEGPKAAAEGTPSSTQPMKSEGSSK